MPFEMAHCVQAMVVQGIVYVGGGFAGYGSYNNYIVMEYNTQSGKWAKWPPYITCDFAMTAINNQLVLVGGWDHGRTCMVIPLLGVWKANQREWTHPYPEMPTARSVCSAVVYNNEWLVVAGGWDGSSRLSSVEIMNVDSKQWHIGPPTPVPWSYMKTALLGDE